VKINCSKNGKEFVFTVEDNGRGIDLQKKGKDLFKPFQRTSSSGSGMGIGLHIVNNMVRKNGGAIKVESTPGKGTKFTIYLKEYH
jgi:signal transduction histidine kinase